MQAAAAKKAATRAGFEIEVLFADSNAVMQIQQVFHFIHLSEAERPAAFLVEPVAGDGYERVARNAVRAGIGWLLMNSRVPYLASLRDDSPNLPISSVSTDQVEIGRIQARQFRALLPRGGALLYVQGPTDTTAATDRYQGLQEEIQGAGFDVRLVEGDWTEAGGERAVTAWLRTPSNQNLLLDLIGCQNDSMAVGARRALHRHRPDWTHLLFTGCDGLPAGGQRLVGTGRLAATVVAPCNAGLAVELVTRFLDKHEPPPLVEILAPRSFPEIRELTARDC